MPIPDYQTLMLPVLQIAADAQDHIIGAVIETLADYFQLTDDERHDLLPSGKQFRFDNRVHWARTYLVQAGLLESAGRAKFRITQRGLEVLQANPSRIDQKYLEQFPEFLAFRNRSHDKQPVDDIRADDSPGTQTPEEMLDIGYQSLKHDLGQQLLDTVKRASPRFFELLVIDLLLAMGYGGSRKDAGMLVGKSHDGGIDGIINQDRLGLDVVYIQAKRWDTTVGRPIVQAFAGSLDMHRARRGILITTSQFSAEAHQYVDRIEKKIVLIDGERLTELMFDYNVGVTEVQTYVVKKLDSDYFAAAD